MLIMTILMTMITMTVLMTIGIKTIEATVEFAGKGDIDDYKVGYES